MRGNRIKGSPLQERCHSQSCYLACGIAPHWWLSHHRGAPTRLSSPGGPPVSAEHEHRLERKYLLPPLPCLVHQLGLSARAENPCQSSRCEAAIASCREPYQHNFQQTSTTARGCRGLRRHSSCPPGCGRWNLQPETTTMCEQRSTPSNSMKKYISTPDQNENDKCPDTNPEVTEVCNLNDREFKIVMVNKLSELQENSMNSRIKLISRGNSSQKRLQL